VVSYIPKHGFATSVVPLLAGCEERLPLPASFIGMMGKVPPMNIMVEDGSGGQPLYQVEILERGWSLIVTHRSRSPILCIRVVDGSGCARAYSPWP
jgi:hypothetical protein